MIEPIIPLLMFIIGLIMVIYSAEKLVKGVVGVSLGFGISAFLVSTIFVGFDPENLAAGAAGTFESVHGIALGSILGASMVAIALAFGITALLAKIKFKKVSKQVLLTPIIATIFLYALSIDSVLSRFDGVLLIVAFIVAIIYMIKANKKGIDIKPEGELEESLEEAEKLSKWKSITIFVLSLAGIIIGSELLVNGAKPIIQFLGISDTVFGMTILAFLISIEELARELPAARKGRADISYGNVVGSIFHFFLLNAGIIALVNPIQISSIVLTFYFPVVLITVVFISLVMIRKEVPKWAGIILVLLYILFVIRGYIV
jgi:cation:H+ antiporter